MYIDLSLINKKNKTTWLKRPKAALLAFTFCFLFFVSKSQVNYVPNPSFEVVDFCGGSFFISVAHNWDALKNGGGGGNSWSDCSNTSILDQVPRTGRAYAGMNYFKNSLENVSWRSYIQAKLIKDLKSNQSYCVTHYANLLNRSKYAIDEMAVYFDDGSISSILPGREAIVNAQIKSPAGVFYSDTLSWMKVQGTFTATGTESYITLGNFKSYAAATFSLAYPSAFAIVAEYYIDDVSVIEADLPAYAGRDTVLCTGDSVFIGRPPEIGLECLWFNPSAGSGSIAAGGGLWVKPATTQTYIVSQDVCGIIKKDTIQVQIKPKYSGPQINLTVSSPTTCPNNTITLNINNNPPGANSKYFWLPQNVYTQTSNINAKANVSQNTIFTLTINNNGENSFCPYQRTNTINIAVPLYTDTPVLQSNLNVVCPQDTLVLNLQTTVPGNTVTYNWYPKPAYTFTNNLFAKSIIQQSTTYSLNIISSGNNSICAFTSSVNVSVIVADTCFKNPSIPNIFTPNNDDVNDVWQIKFPYGYALQDLEIYNRWGTLIYERNNLEFKINGYTKIGWDGRTTSGEECSAGVYFYVVKYTDRNNEVKIGKGNVTLMR